MTHLERACDTLDAGVSGEWGLISDSLFRQDRSESARKTWEAHEKTACCF